MNDTRAVTVTERTSAGNMAVLTVRDESGETYNLCEVASCFADIHPGDTGTIRQYSNSYETWWAFKPEEKR